MDRTALTVGGFTQPSVARALIELPASIEKGLTPRFLWIFPKPSFAGFSTLEPVEEEFSHYLGEVKAHTCMYSVWYVNSVSSLVQLLYVDVIILY